MSISDRGYPQRFAKSAFVWEYVPRTESTTISWQAQSSYRDDLKSRNATGGHADGWRLYRCTHSWRVAAETHSGGEEPVRIDRAGHTERFWSSNRRDR